MSFCIIESGNEVKNLSITLETNRRYKLAANLFNLIMRSTSATMVLVAIVIFFSCRNLYSKDHYKIHIHLFTSNLFMDVSLIRFETYQHEYFSISNPTALCEFLNNNNLMKCEEHHCAQNAMRVYLGLCNYSWMSCEALYLCYVIYRVWFNNEIVLKIIQSLGWLIPAILTGTFVALTWSPCERHPYDWLCKGDTKSWEYKAFVLAPANISLIMNTVVLFSIAVYLTLGTSQLPQSFKRGFRSLAILTPLLGAHQLILEFASGSNVGNIIISVFSASQGIFLAVIFCFTHVDVQTEFARKWRRSFTRTFSTSTSCTVRTREPKAVASTEFV